MKRMICLLILFISSVLPTQVMSRTARQNLHSISAPAAVALLTTAVASGLWWRKRLKEAKAIRSKDMQSRSVAMIARTASGLPAVPPTKMARNVFVGSTLFTFLMTALWYATRANGSDDDPINTAELQAQVDALVKQQRAKDKEERWAAVAFDPVVTEVMIAPETVECKDASTGMKKGDFTPAMVDAGMGTDSIEPEPKEPEPPKEPKPPKNPMADLDIATTSVDIQPEPPKVPVRSITPPIPSRPIPSPPPPPPPAPVDTTFPFSLRSPKTPSPPPSSVISPASSTRSLGTQERERVHRDIKRLLTGGHIQLPMNVKTAAAFLRENLTKTGDPIHGATYSSATLSELSPVWAGLTHQNGNNGIILVGTKGKPATWGRILVSLRKQRGVNFRYQLVTTDKSGKQSTEELQSNFLITLTIFSQNRTDSDEGRDAAYKKMQKGLEAVEARYRQLAKNSAERFRRARDGRGGRTPSHSTHSSPAGARRRLDMDPPVNAGIRGMTIGTGSGYRPHRTSSTSPRSVSRPKLRPVVDGKPPLSPPDPDVHRAFLNLSSAVAGVGPPFGGSPTDDDRK